MVTDVEAVMALMDVVYCGQVRYLVRRDGWFGHIDKSTHTHTGAPLLIS